MTIQEYIERENKDSNFFWRLSEGARQNLLDQAIEKIKELNERLKEYEHSKENR